MYQNYNDDYHAWPFARYSWQEMCGVSVSVCVHFSNARLMVHPGQTFHPVSILALKQYIFWMIWQVLPVFGLVACKGSMNIPLPILSRYPDVSFMYWTAFVYVWFQSSAWTNLHVKRPAVCVLRC